MGRHLPWDRARLLREYAEQIGIDPGFTIHDREDSADLMNMVRHNLGLRAWDARSQKANRLFYRKHRRQISLSSLDGEESVTPQQMRFPL